jgi:hypothetical protein
MGVLSSGPKAFEVVGIKEGEEGGLFPIRILLYVPK